jgi:methyltransferase (TIGR00027 family)
LCGEEGLSLGRQLERIGGAHDAIVARTCIIDERIGAALTTDRIDKVVMLGAGLDARPFRLTLPASLRWVEVDLPDASAFNRERLGERRAPVDHHFVAADLSAASGDVIETLDRRSLVIVEGVLVYLERAAAEQLLRAIAGQGARVIADIGAKTPLRRLQRSARAAETRGAPFRTQIDRADDWFESLGFNVVANTSLYDWDAARTDARWRKPFTNFFRPMIRDLARVIDARSAR